MKCPGFGLVELLKDKESLVGIEIGCDEGVTAEYLLESLPQLKLYSIDPYNEYVDWNTNPVHQTSYAYDKMMERTARFGDRFTIIKDKSENVVDQFEDGSLDFIFIDGIHTYDAVTLDCNNYYSKVKESGLFSGHDYSVISCVGEAVNAFAKEKNKEISTTEVDVWYFWK